MSKDNQEPLECDLCATQLFLQTVHGEENPEVHFVALSDSKKGPSKLHEFSTFEEIERRALQLNQKNFGLFAPVNRTDGKGTKDENVISLNSLFIDSETPEIPKEWPLMPSLIVQSGRGFHAYWLLMEGEDLNKFVSSQKILSLFYGSDSSVCNLSRLMRLPGFFHTKDPSNPKPVKIISISDRRFSIEEVINSHLKVLTGGLPLDQKQTEFLAWTKKVSLAEGRNNALTAILREGLAQNFDHSFLEGFSKAFSIRTGLSLKESLQCFKAQITYHRKKPFETNLNFGKSLRPIKARFLEDITRRPMEFIFPGLFPKGLLSTFTGTGGIGKSYFLICLSAAISVGAKMYGTELPQGVVVYLNTDDDHERTLAPRFDKFICGKKSLVLIEEVLNLDARPGKDDDYKRIEEILELYKPIVLIVDPVVAQFGQASKSNEASDVYARMTRLNEIAKKYDVSIIAIRHTTKDQAIDPANAGTGSAAFTNAARSEVLCFVHPDDKDLRVLLPTKANDFYKDTSECLGFRLSKDGKFTLEKIKEDGLQLYKKTLLLNSSTNSKSSADDSGNRKTLHAEIRKMLFSIFEETAEIESVVLFEEMKQASYGNKYTREVLQALVEEGILENPRIAVKDGRRGEAFRLFRRVDAKFFAKLKEMRQESKDGILNLSDD